MSSIADLRSSIDGQDLSFLAEIPYVFHCHHFNLFHDQTVEDALGEELGIQLKTRAAQRVCHDLLKRLSQGTGATTPAERLELATGLLPAIGHGRLEPAVEAGGGSARGDYLHYSYTWREKYGKKVTRSEPIDAFAAGFLAAATEVAYDLEQGSMGVEEAECYVAKSPHCQFELRPTANGHPTPPTVDRQIYADRVAAPMAGLDEDRIAKIAAGLVDFLSGVSGDQRGLVQAFGVYVTLHLSSYYNETAFEAIRHIESVAPQSSGAVEQLFGESGHVCAFNTFGNILLSPEWEAMVGPLSGEVEDTVSFCCAIARALGFGHWAIHELDPDRRLVLRCSSNYEIPFYLARYGESDRPRSYFFSNAARAIMQLAHKVDWKSRPELTEEVYASLFRQGVSWTFEQTQCPTRGDEICEVVVERA